MSISNRREFLTAAAAVVTAARAGATTRGMQLHLSCGALGIKATQREAIDYAAEFGFDVVDADGRYLAGLSDAERSDLLGYMQSRKVGWAMAGLPVDFRRGDAEFAAGMKDFPAYAKSLQRAGVQRVTTWITPASAQLTYLVNFRVHAFRLRAIASVLDGNGIRFGVEYVGPKTAWASQRYPFIHDMATMKELFAEINGPNVGFVLDSWHWYTSGETKQDVLSLRGSEVVSVDLNDAPAGIAVDQQIDNRRELPAATGVIKIADFLGALQTIGFNGPVRAEPFNQAVREMPPKQALAAAMASLKKAFSETV
jgi:sugar phosphate isomerase/epimerase